MGMFCPSVYLPCLSADIPVMCQFSYEVFFLPYKSRMDEDIFMTFRIEVILLEAAPNSYFLNFLQSVIRGHAEK
jgi:hypothetical protein